MMVARTDDSPRRFSVANTYTGSTPTPASSPTPPRCPPAPAPVPVVGNPNPYAPQSGVAYNVPAMPGFPQSPFSYTPGVWLNAGVPPFAVNVRHPGSCGTGSPPPSSTAWDTPKERRSGDASSSRRKSPQRADKPYMLQRCGPFYAWQLLIMWMAVLGTVVFVCTFGAFRHYLIGVSLEGSNRAKTSPLKNANLRRMHQPPVDVNASCGIQNPCRGVGQLCIGRHCHCGPDFVEQGELCSPKRNVRSQGGVDVPSSPSHPDRRSREDADRDVSIPLQGAHRGHSLNGGVVHRRSKEIGKASTFVFPTYEYEENVHKNAPNSLKSLKLPKSVKAPSGVKKSPTKNVMRIPTHRRASKHRRRRLGTTKQSSPAI